MKKKLIALLAAALIVSLCTAALAGGVVRATASVNLRKGPGLDYGKVAAIRKGVTLDYLGEISTDARGVDWYKASYKGQSVWVSSRYSELDEDEDDAAYDDDVTYDDDADTAPGTDAAPLPEFGDNDRTELSGFYLDNLTAAAGALGLDDYRQEAASELQNYYSNEALVIAGNNVAEYFNVIGTGYSLFGVYVGMDAEDAKAALTEAGLTRMDGTLGMYFQHPASDRSLANVDGFDSGISLDVDAQGAVTQISWNSYSG